MRLKVGERNFDTRQRAWRESLLRPDNWLRLLRGKVGALKTA